VLANKGHWRNLHFMKDPQAYLSKIEQGKRGVDAVELAEFAKSTRNQ